MGCGTHARDLPLKTTGGATAAKMTKPIWTYRHHKEWHVIHENVIPKTRYYYDQMNILPSKTGRTSWTWMHFHSCDTIYNKR